MERSVAARVTGLWSGCLYGNMLLAAARVDAHVKSRGLKSVNNRRWDWIGEDRNVQAYPHIHRWLGSGAEGCRSGSIACKGPWGPRHDHHGHGTVPCPRASRDRRWTHSWAVRNGPV